MAKCRGEMQSCNRQYHAIRIPSASLSDVKIRSVFSAALSSEHPSTAASALRRGGGVPLAVPHRHCPLRCTAVNTPPSRSFSSFDRRPCVPMSRTGREGTSGQLHGSYVGAAGQRSSDDDNVGTVRVPLWPTSPGPYGRPVGRVLQVGAPLELSSTSHMPVRFIVSHLVVSGGLLNLVLEGRDGGGAHVRLPLPLPLPSQIRFYSADGAIVEGHGEACLPRFGPSSANSQPGCGYSGTRSNSNRKTLGQQQPQSPKTKLHYRVHDSQQQQQPTRPYSKLIAPNPSHVSIGSRGVQTIPPQVTLTTAECASAAAAAQASASTSADQGDAHSTPTLSNTDIPVRQEAAGEGRTGLSGVSAVRAPNGAALPGASVGSCLRGSTALKAAFPNWPPPREPVGNARLSIARPKKGDGGSSSDGGPANDVRLLSRPELPSVARILAGFMPMRLVRRSGILYLSHRDTRLRWRTKGPKGQHAPGDASPAAGEGRGHSLREGGGWDVLKLQQLSPYLQLLRAATPKLGKSVTPAFRGDTVAAGGAAAQGGGTPPQISSRGPIAAVRTEGIGSNGAGVRDRREHAAAFRPTVMVSRRGSISVCEAWRKWDGAGAGVMGVVEDAMQRPDVSQTDGGGLQSDADAVSVRPPGAGLEVRPPGAADDVRGPWHSALLQILRAANPRGPRAPIAPSHRLSDFAERATTAAEVVSGSRFARAASLSAKAAAATAIAVPPSARQNAAATAEPSVRAAATAAAEAAFPGFTPDTSRQRDRRSWHEVDDPLTPLEASVTGATSLEHLYGILDVHWDSLEARLIVLACRVLVGLTLQSGLTTSQAVIGPGTARTAAAPPWYSPITGAVHCYASVLDYHRTVSKRPGPRTTRAAPGGAQPSIWGEECITHVAGEQRQYSDATGTRTVAGEQGPRHGLLESSEHLELLSLARRCVGRLARRAAALVGDHHAAVAAVPKLGESGAKELTGRLVSCDRRMALEVSLSVLWAYGHLADPEDRLDLQLVSELDLWLLVGMASGWTGDARSRTWRPTEQWDGLLHLGAGPGDAAALGPTMNPTAIADPTDMPFRGIMCRLWRVVLLGLWAARLVELGSQGAGHLPGDPSRASSPIRIPQLQQWIMRALWASERGAPTLLPGVLLTLAAELPQLLPPSQSLVEQQQRARQPELTTTASGGWQTDAKCAGGCAVPQRTEAEMPESGGVSLPVLSQMSAGQLVSVLWACSRYAGWLEERSSRTRRKKYRVARYGWLERRRAAFSAVLGGIIGGNSVGGRRDVARSLAQQMACVAASALRLLAARVASQPGLHVETVLDLVLDLPQQQQPHKPSWQHHHRDQQRRQEGQPPAAMSGGASPAAAPSKPAGDLLSRQDLLAALEGATTVLEGMCFENEVLTLVTALSTHPAVRLQDLTAALRMLQDWLPPRTHTPQRYKPGAIPPPAVTAATTHTAAARPQHHTHHHDGSHAVVAGSAAPDTLFDPLAFPGGARPGAANAVAGAAPSGAVQAAAGGRPPGGPSDAAAVLLGLEATVLRLLGDMRGEEAEEMLRLQSLGSRGLRPRRGWYRTHLRLPRLARGSSMGTTERDEIHQQQQQQQQPNMRHPVFRDESQGFHHQDGQDSDASRVGDSGPIDRWRHRSGGGYSPQQSLMRLTRRLAHPLPLRLRLLYRLGPSESAGNEADRGWAPREGVCSPADGSVTSTDGLERISGTADGDRNTTTAAVAIGGNSNCGGNMTRRGIGTHMRSLELQLRHQQRLYEDETVWRYGTSDLLDLLEAMGAAAKAGCPRPRCVTVRCLLNALALRWLRSGVVQGDVRALIATLCRLGWRPRAAVTVFTTAWRPFVVLAPQSVSDAAVAGMAQVLGCLISHDFVCHPGGRAAAAAEGGMAWPKLRRFWVNLLALASARLQTGGLQLPDGAVVKPAAGGNPAVQPVLSDATATGTSAQYRSVGLDESASAIIGAGLRARAGASGADGHAVVPAPSLPPSALSARSLVRLVWSSGRQGARVPQLLGTACRVLLPWLPQLHPGVVGALAWGLGQPRFCAPRMNTALLSLLRRWLVAAEDSGGGDDTEGYDCNWTAACRIATALLQLRHISASTPELASLLRHITSRLQRHNRYRNRGCQRSPYSQAAHQDYSAGGGWGRTQASMEAVRRGRGDIWSWPDGLAPEMAATSNRSPCCRTAAPGNSNKWKAVHGRLGSTTGPLSLHEVVNPRALANLLWALHSELGPIHSASSTARPGGRGARRRLRLLASRSAPIVGCRAGPTFSSPSQRESTASLSDSTACAGCAPTGSDSPVSGWGIRTPAGAADGQSLRRRGPTLLEEHPELFRSAAAFLARRSADLPPVSLLQLLQIMAFSRPPGRLVSPTFLDAFGRLVEVRPRWLLQSEAQARTVLECYRRLGWWPVGQVEEIGSRMEELRRAPWRHKPQFGDGVF
ncbi:hypothetical protein VaNZ11_011925 [Volvox africanus]|uniref:Uncharacterized protein n=1 Tax=Volvox africanus TaxID=51714 RepID=A0ABQ5SCU1_9CHLO|nr:hypothetical protein VaNZ11_011925 [Volvox africanus]